MKTVVLSEYPACNYTLLARINDRDEVHEFVAAFMYDKDSKTWGQGHYFSTLESAYGYIAEKYCEAVA